MELGLEGLVRFFGYIEGQVQPHFSKPPRGLKDDPLKSQPTFHDRTSLYPFQEYHAIRA